MHTTIKTITGCMFAFAALTACSDEDAAPTSNIAHGVSITLIVPGTCANLCVPPESVYTKLASVHITNISDETRYLAQCGDNVKIVHEQFDGAAWVANGPAVACPIDHGPISPAPGASIDSWRFLPVGQFRIAAAIATTSAATDFALPFPTQSPSKPATKSRYLLTHQHHAAHT